MQNSALDIIWQDEHYVAINKPQGLLVHKSPIDKHETRFALQMLRDQIGQRVYPVHRLDKPTSGLLIFALHSEATRLMQEAFTQRQIEKTYLAVVRGFVAESLLIDHPVKAVIDKQHGKENTAAKEAQTQLHCLAHAEIAIAVDKYPSSRYSLVKLLPKQGRRHQLRYHMKHIAHPIIGDPKYGKSVHNHFFSQHFNSHGLLLSATQLSFKHPFSGEPIQLTAKPSENFLQACSALGLQQALATENTNYV